jgi:hypothetical protein
LSYVRGYARTRDNCVTHLQRSTKKARPQELGGRSPHNTTPRREIYGPSWTVNFHTRLSATNLLPSFTTCRRFDGETSNTTFALRSAIDVNEPTRTPDQPKPTVLMSCSGVRVSLWLCRLVCQVSALYRLASNAGRTPSLVVQARLPGESLHCII